MRIDLATIRRAIGNAAPEDLPGLMGLLRERLEGDFAAWLRWLFPTYVIHDFAEHHVEFWRWVWALKAGVHSDPFVAIWARGGAKSTSSELAVVAVGALKARNYVLYICDKQDQADDHVGNVGTLFETQRLGDLYPMLGSRMVGKYGASKGWRRNRVRTASGFTVDAIGLDTAARGVKLDEDRPDLVVLDDLDDALDTPRTTERKITALTRSLLPAQASAGAVLAVQNLVLPNGVFAKLAGVASEPADFLTKRTLSMGGPVPALRGMATERDNEGHTTIIAGEPTWAGQSLATCQAQMDEWGARAFRIEAQHEVKLRTSGLFKPEWWRIVPAEAVPVTGMRWVRYWDKAASAEPAERAKGQAKGRDPDWTVGALIGLHTEGMTYVRDIRRRRDTPRGVELLIAHVAAIDAKMIPGGVEIWMEQEPGATGVESIDHYRRHVLVGYTVHPDKKSGTIDSKIARATPLSSACEAGNVFMVEGKWNAVTIDEAEDFPDGDHDDIVDGMSGGFWALTKGRAHLIRS